jgi:hydroxymethylbilane synthase
MAALRIGSRGSQLARWQADHIAGLLRSRGHEVSIDIIRTTGDKVLDVALSRVGTKGMFTKELEDALADGRIDLAVHSLKDLPTDLPSGFALAAITTREDPRDVFVSSRYPSLSALPARARVGTSSLRRQAQLHALRRDLQIVTLRGNVDTRLRKLETGEFDAVILAAAGLRRLGANAPFCVALPPEQMCPAAGQGALAIEARHADRATHEAVSFLNDRNAHLAVSAERAALAKLGGGCQVPIGAYARVDEGRINLMAVVARPDGSKLIREQQSGADPQELGAAVGEALLARGAAEILAEVYGAERPAMIAVPQQP